MNILIKPLAFLILLATIISFQSCNKRRDDGLRCNELLSQRQPDRAILVFQDKVTGQPIIKEGGLAAKDIQVIRSSDQKSITNWRVAPDQPNSPIRGAVEIIIFEPESSEAVYQVKLGSEQSVLLKFKVTAYKADGPCGVDYLQAGDFKVEGAGFDYFEYQKQVYKNILIVKV